MPVVTLVDELLRREGSRAPTAMRVSLGLGNRVEHVKRLIAAIESLVTNGPSRRYTRDTEGIWRADDHEVVAAPLPWYGPQFSTLTRSPSQLRQLYANPTGSRVRG